MFSRRGALAVCVMCLMVAGVAGAQQNVPPPPKPADEGPSLAETMKFIQGTKFGSQDVVSWTNKYSDGSTQPVEHESKEVFADPGTCTLKFRQTEKMNTSGSISTSDTSVVGSLRDVEKIMVETDESAANRFMDRIGLQAARFTSPPAGVFW